MVSTSDFNWTLPHGRMQFCHMVTYDHVLRTREFLTVQGFRSFVRFSKSNLYRLYAPYSSSKFSSHEPLHFFPDTYHVSILLFYSLLQLHSDMLVQPTRIPGTAGMLEPIPDHPDRPDPDRPDNGTHAAVYPPVGNFWCATIHCSSEHRSCSSETRNCKAAHDTKGRELDTTSRFRLIHLRRSASHSVIAIFR
jgi:hypothetical protein